MCKVCKKPFHEQELRDHPKFPEFPLCADCLKKVDEADKALSGVKTIRVSQKDVPVG